MGESKLENIVSALAGVASSAILTAGMLYGPVYGTCGAITAAAIIGGNVVTGGRAIAVDKRTGDILTASDAVAGGVITTSSLVGIFSSTRVPEALAVITGALAIAAGTNYLAKQPKEGRNRNLRKYFVGAAIGAAAVLGHHYLF